MKYVQKHRVMRTQPLLAHLPPLNPPPFQISRPLYDLVLGLQGYLSCNRFGSLVGFAHAGITAEGDNRVLFQKTAKELTSHIHTPAVRARLAAGQHAPVVSAQRCGCNMGGGRLG